MHDLLTFVQGQIHGEDGNLTHTRTHITIHMYIYVYVVPVGNLTNTRTQTHIYMYIHTVPVVDTPYVDILIPTTSSRGRQSA